MKLRVLSCALLALAAGPALAADITSTHSVQTTLGVDALSTVNERLGSSVSASGENIAVTLPSLGAGAAGTAVATTAPAAATIVSAGSPFSYSASAFAGSSAATMTPTVSNPTGTLTALGGADKQTVVNGGIAGTLAATNTGDGLATITAGGAGTSATLTRSNVLSVFN